MSRAANDLVQILNDCLPEGFFGWAAESRPDAARYVGEAESELHAAVSAGDERRFAEAVRACSAMYLRAVGVYERDIKRPRRLTYSGTLMVCGEQVSTKGGVMMEESDLVSLANLGKGAAIERFDDEFSRALNNVVDPNTGEGARTITLKVKIKPNANRTACDVAVVCTSTLACAKPFQTQIFVGKERGQAKATEYNPEQQFPLLSTEPTPLRSVQAGEVKKL